MPDITEPTVIPSPPDWLSVPAQLLHALGIERPDDLLAALPLLLGLALFTHITRTERRKRDESGKKGES